MKVVVCLVTYGVLADCGLRSPRNRTLGLTMISVKKAHHVGGHLIDIEFSDGVSGVVDLRDTVSRYEAAAEIRDPTKFADFHLDEWPTLVWPCAFDLAPEYLYELLTGAAPTWSERAPSGLLVLAEPKPQYRT
jgi:hypothetical protein